MFPPLPGASLGLNQLNFCSSGLA